MYYEKGLKNFFKKVRLSIIYQLSICACQENDSNTKF